MQASCGYYSLNRWLQESDGDQPWSQTNLRGVQTANGQNKGHGTSAES
jgi:hypothetical protein